MVKLSVKPTAGGQKIEVEADPSSSVLELKELLAPTCNIPAAEQRLVWKGQILKDERTVDSYGEWVEGHEVAACWRVVPCVRMKGARWRCAGAAVAYATPHPTLPVHAPSAT